MSKESPLPRHILAKSLQSLKVHSGLSAPEIARRAKPPVDRKTVTNYLNAKSDPRPELVEAIAQGFGLTASILLSPDFRPEITTDSNIPKLIKAYANADEDGRDAIMRVAEIAAQHRP